MYSHVEIITKSGEVTSNGSNATTEDQGEEKLGNNRGNNADYGVWFSNCSTINM